LDLVPEKIALDIIYEDDHVIVVNKVPGMVVHPSMGHTSGTLLHAILAHAPDIIGIGGERRPGLVHRLDKDTSGVIILAKDDHTHWFLQKQFKQRMVEKNYLALVYGSPPTPTGRVETPIGRDPKNRKRMAVVPEEKGRQALSEYKTVERFKQHSLLEVRILTGRTHQIRVHMAFLKCPVVGDTLYGQRKEELVVGRQMLHAARLRLRLQEEDEARVFEAALPDDFASALDTLRLMT
jgi:23S rRNA pseudouridine1911/1915/1917 synthase